MAEREQQNGNPAMNRFSKSFTNHEGIEGELLINREMDKKGAGSLTMQSKFALNKIN